MGQENFYVELFYTVVLVSLILSNTQGQTTPRLLLPSERIPVLTTSRYAVNVTKPLLETATEVEDLACGKRHLCNAINGKHFSAHCYDCPFQCKCDESCHTFGDCCADLAFEDVGNTTPLQTGLKCLKKLPKDNKNSKLKILGTDQLFMVAKCPEYTTADQDTVRRCENASKTDYQEATPVTDVSNNLVYRNVFCAKCYGVITYKAWTYKIECKVGSSVEKAASKAELWRRVLEDPGCTVNNSPPEGTLSTLRYCLGDTVDMCNVTGLWREYNSVTEKLCSGYYHPVKYQDDNKLYRNVFCAMCNGAVVDRRKRCFSRSRFDVVPRIGPGSISQPLSVLIDFNSDPVESPPTPTTDSFPMDECMKGEVFEPLSSTCVPLQCSQRRILVGGQCEPLYRSSQGLGYSLNLVVEPSQEMFVNDTLSVPDAFEDRLLDRLGAFQPLALTVLQFKPYARPVSSGADQLPLTGIHVSASLVSTAGETIQTMERVLQNLDEITVYVASGGSNVSLTTRFITCPVSESLFEKGKLVEENSISFLSLPQFQFPNCYDGSCVASVQYLPTYGILECPHVEINLTTTNATFDSQNNTIIVSNQSLVINSSDYYFCGDILKLCEDVVYDLQELLQDANETTPWPNPPGDYNIAMTILSIICISLSLLCLLITFIVYCIVPPLRTLPGKNTMALIVHLFFAQLIFQIGIQLNFNVSLCRAMGVLIHYFWLTAFAWMAVSAYHMCAVFSNMASSRFSSKSEVKRTLLKYTVLCNVYTLVFILSCVVYHLVSSQGVEMGYGGDICFLNEPADIGIFFALPLGVILAFNVVCFIRTVLSIRDVPNMNRSKTKPDRNHMHVYFRLSILLGFTWIFGFVAAVFRKDALWYIFIILNGLQGVFIFVAYCLNKRTIRMLQAALNQRREIKYSRPSKTTSTDKTSQSTSV